VSNYIYSHTLFSEITVLTALSLIMKRSRWANKSSLWVNRGLPRINRFVWVNRLLWFTNVPWEILTLAIVQSLCSVVLFITVHILNVQMFKMLTSNMYNIEDSFIILAISSVIHSLIYNKIIHRRVENLKFTIHLLFK